MCGWIRASQEETGCCFQEQAQTPPASEAVGGACVLFLEQSVITVDGEGK